MTKFFCMREGAPDVHFGDSERCAMILCSSPQMPFLHARSDDTEDKLAQSAGHAPQERGRRARLLQGRARAGAFPSPCLPALPEGMRPEMSRCGAHLREESAALLPLHEPCRFPAAVHPVGLACSRSRGSRAAKFCRSMRTMNQAGATCDQCRGCACTDWRMWLCRVCRWTDRGAMDEVFAEIDGVLSAFSEEDSAARRRGDMSRRMLVDRAGLPHGASHAGRCQNRSWREHIA